MNWETYLDYRAGAAHTVSGDVRVLRDFHSPQLDNKRDLLVYLPASYENSHKKRYPVIYMQDGQNVYDAHTSFAGEWHVDETMETLSGQHLEALVVALPNTGNFRIVEYNPFNHARFGQGRGSDYIDFIAHTVKPLIDSTFRTRTERRYTGLLGSSMGGLISLYGFLYRQDVFGFVGAMSPSFWLGYDHLTRMIETIERIEGKIYLDIGTHEMSQNAPRKGKSGKLKVDHSQRYADNVEHVGQILQAKLNQRKSYKFVRDENGTHSEADWSKRLPDALKFLLSGL